MKSTRSFSRFMLLVLFLGTMASVAIPAQAQRATGTFTLAHKVRWGNAVLPSGAYTFAFDSPNAIARLTVRQVDGPMVAILLPQVVANTEIEGRSNLILHQQNGESVVSAMQLETLGLTLEFTWPRPANVAETATLGPVAGPGSAR